MVPPTGQGIHVHTHTVHLLFLSMFISNWLHVLSLCQKPEEVYTTGLSVSVYTIIELCALYVGVWFLQLLPPHSMARTVLIVFFPSVYSTTDYVILGCFFLVTFINVVLSMWFVQGAVVYPATISTTMKESRNGMKVLYLTTSLGKETILPKILLDTLVLPRATRRTRASGRNIEKISFLPSEVVGKTSHCI